MSMTDSRRIRTSIGIKIFCLTAIMDILNRCEGHAGKAGIRRPKISHLYLLKSLDGDDKQRRPLLSGLAGGYRLAHQRNG